MQIDWRHQTEVSFFGNGLTIEAISKATGVSRRSISAYLNSLPHYKDEVERRKKSNSNRKDYYREHKRKRRTEQPITGEVLRQEHETAVRILSKERHFNGW